MKCQKPFQSEKSGYDLTHISIINNSLIFGEISSLKYFSAILLLVAFAAHTFSKQFIVAGYYANTAAFAKNCENKARPKMHCNGHCQMMKKLKQEESKDKQNPERKSDGKEEVLSSRSFFTSLNFFTARVQTKYPLLAGGKASHMPRSFFHPPGYTASI